MQHPSNDRLKRNAEHVYYEILMLFYTTQKLTKDTLNSTHICETNMRLESCGIHLRNLLDFFYTPIPKRYADDMLAEDYIQNIALFKKNRTKWSELDHLNKRVNKMISHLTYHRSRYNKKTKGWNYGQIYIRLHPTIVAFYDALPTHRKEWVHFVELKKIIDI